jgi:hypothetical protein
MSARDLDINASMGMGSPERPPDLVEIQPGVVHLPQEFWEAVIKANAAGRDGYEVDDVLVGWIDSAEATQALESIPAGPIRSYIRITYRKRGSA